MRAMKKAAKIYLFGLALITVAAVVTLLVLPNDWQAGGSVEIKAPAPKVHPYVNSLKNWQRWAIGDIKAEDPDAEITFSGPETGVGATMSWSSETMGRGHYTITRSDPGEGVWYEAALQGDEVNSHGHFTYVKTADGTRVTWFEDGALPGVLGGLQAGPVGDAMTKLHEDRLSKLKALAEGEQGLKP